MEGAPNSPAVIAGGSPSAVAATLGPSTPRQRPAAIHAGAGVGAGAGAPASPMTPGSMSDEEVARLALARMRARSQSSTTRKPRTTPAGSARTVGGAMMSAAAAARLKKAAQVRLEEQKEDAEREAKKAAEEEAARAAALPLKSRLLAPVVKMLDKLTWAFCDPGFLARALRFIALLLVVHMYVPLLCCITSHPASG